MIAIMRIEDPMLDLPAEEGARVLVLALLGEATDAADALARGAGDEPLHDFRVAVRRLRSALRSFRPWLEDGVPRRHEKRLRKVARSTNEARDAEVQLAWLEKRREALAPRQRAGHDAVVERIEARAHGGPAAARVAARFRRAERKLRRRLRRTAADVEGGGGASLRSALASLVRDQVDALAAKMAAIRDSGDQRGVHEARIEGKRLRYLLEPLRGHRGADAAEVIRHLKRLQDVLGELHDAHVLAFELREALVDATAARARQLHAALYAPDASDDAAIRDALRASARPGIVGLIRLVRERRDALHAKLDREWRAPGMETLAAGVRDLAAALDEGAGRKREREARFRGTTRVSR